MVFPLKKKNEGGGERKVKISRTGNPAARPWLVRIYGMVGCLAITLAFIGIIVWLQKKLPDGSKSQFHPTWKRDTKLDTLEARANVSFAPGATLDTNFVFLPPATSTSTSPPHFSLVGPFHNPLTFDLNLPCHTTQVTCTTIEIPGKKAKRGAYYQTICSTATGTVACPVTPTPTPTPSPTSAPHFTLFGPPVTFDINLLPCRTTQVSCTTFNVPGKLRKRQGYLQTICSTAASIIPCPSIPTRSSSSSSVVVTAPPSSTSTIYEDCLSTTIYCPDGPSAGGCYATEYLGPCTSSSKSTSTTKPLLSSSSTSSIDRCVTTEITCPVLIPKEKKRQGGTDCITSYITAASCLPSTSSPTRTPSRSVSVVISVTETISNSTTVTRGPVTSTSDSCVTRWCTFYWSSAIAEYVTDCAATTPPLRGEYDPTTICRPSSTSSSSLMPTTTSSPPSSCVTKFCGLFYDSSIESNVYGCSTSVEAEAEYDATTICGITSTSSSIPTPTGCLGSTVICETFAQIGKRQGATQVYDTTCATSFFPSTGCGRTLTSTSSSSSRTPTPTGCLGSTVICNTFAQIGKRQGATQVYETACATSYFPSTSCGITSISSTTTSSRTPTPTGCVGSTVICNTFAQIGKRQGATQVYETACATSFFPSTGCGITSTSSVSSSRTTSTISIPSCMTTTVSCTSFEVIGKRQLETSCATALATIPGCGQTTSNSSSPIITSTSSRSSSSIPLPSNSCLSTGVSCDTYFPAVSVGAIIADLGGFLTATTTHGPITDCTTTYSTLAICGVTITSNSSSSTPITSTSSSTYRSSVSTSSSSSSSFSLLSSSSTSSIVRSPTVTPSSTSSVLSSTSSLSSSSFSFSPSVSVTPSSVSVSSPSLLSSSSSSISTVVVLSKGTVSVPVSSPSTSAPAPSSSASSGTLSLPPVLIVSPPSSVPPSPSSIVSVTLSLSPSVPIPSPSVTPGTVVTPSLSPSPPSLTPGVTPTSPVPVVSPSNNPSISVESATKPLVAVVIPGSSIPSNILTTPSITPASVSAPTSPAATPLPATSPSILASVSTTNSASTPSRSVIISSSAIPSVESEISSSATGTRASASASASGTGGGGGGGGGDGNNATDVSINSDASIYPISKVITGNYVPIIVARGFVAVLTPFYNSILLHEPVRLLTNPGGASIAALSGNPGMEVPIHFAMFVAHLGSGFAAGATFLDTSYCDAVPCPPKLSANPWVMDVIICTLVVQAVAIMTVISQWWRKPSGLSADPTSIAGVAVVMGHPKIEHDFQSIPSDITSSDLKKRLRGERYKLGTFMTAAGQVKYGIMPVPDSERKRPRKDRGPGFFTRIKDRIPFIDNWRNNKLYFDCIFLMFLLALLGLTCAALSRVDKPKVVFLATAAASGTGMRIFLAILGILVSFYWGRVFTDMQTFTPYTTLGRGDAEPEPTILLRKHTFPITAFFPLLFNSHYVAASVAFTGIAAEFLILALAGMPYRPGQVRGEFLFWSCIALFILTLMAIQLIVVVLWRRRLPVLARAPDTIASVMTYVAGTGMARDFEDLSMCKTKERNRIVKNMGKSYVYGWRREDGTGRVRWVVDEVGVKDSTPVPSSRVNSF